METYFIENVYNQLFILLFILLGLILYGIIRHRWECKRINEIHKKIIRLKKFEIKE